MKVVVPPSAFAQAATSPSGLQLHQRIASFNGDLGVLQDYRASRAASFNSHVNGNPGQFWGPPPGGPAETAALTGATPSFDALLQAFSPKHSSNGAATPFSPYHPCGLQAHTPRGGSGLQQFGSGQLHHQDVPASGLLDTLKGSCPALSTASSFSSVLCQQQAMVNEFCPTSPTRFAEGVTRAHSCNSQHLSQELRVASIGAVSQASSRRPAMPSKLRNGTTMQQGSEYMSLGPDTQPTPGLHTATPKAIQEALLRIYGGHGQQSGLLTSTQVNVSYNTEMTAAMGPSTDTGLHAVQAYLLSNVHTALPGAPTNQLAQVSGALPAATGSSHSQHYDRLRALQSSAASQIPGYGSLDPATAALLMHGVGMSAPAMMYGSNCDEVHGAAAAGGSYQSGLASMPVLTPEQYAVFYQQYLAEAQVTLAPGLHKPVQTHSGPIDVYGVRGPDILHSVMGQPGSRDSSDDRHSVVSGPGCYSPRAPRRNSAQPYAVENQSLGGYRVDSPDMTFHTRFHTEEHMAGRGVVQGCRSSKRESEQRSSALLEELKVMKGRGLDVQDLLGHIHSFSMDQQGSRFIQQKLETATTEELDAALNEVLPSALSLITDVFANFVMQKFLQLGSAQQRARIAEVLTGQVLGLSLHMYGCRVVQKAFQVLGPEAQCRLLSELDGNVMRCVRDQNGNHVIQQIIACVPTQHITGLLDNFLTCVVPLSTHPFGCRVIQRSLEHCTDVLRKGIILDEVVRHVPQLAQDQYGNYVVQHVVQFGAQSHRAGVVAALTPQILQMTNHKFSSNVVEMCLRHCLAPERDVLIKAIMGPTIPFEQLPDPVDNPQPVVPGSPEDTLHTMMKDQYGNFVAGVLLEVCDEHQRAHLLNIVRSQLHILRKYTYGKHIVTRVEKLLSAGTKMRTTLRVCSLPDDTAPLTPSLASTSAGGGVVTSSAASSTAGATGQMCSQACDSSSQSGQSSNSAL